jgi:hypothetical protein
MRIIAMDVHGSAGLNTARLKRPMRVQVPPPALRFRTSLQHHTRHLTRIPNPIRPLHDKGAGNLFFGNTAMARQRATDVALGPPR